MREKTKTIKYLLSSLSAGNEIENSNNLSSANEKQKSNKLSLKRLFRK